MLSKFFSFIKKHKIIFIIVLLLIIFGGYFGYTKLFNKGEEVRYVTTKATKGSIVSIVSGVGQVSAYNQADIKSETSGEIISIKVANGDEVKKGDFLVQIDTKDAKQGVADAEINLETARIELQDLLDSPDELEVLKAENNLSETYKSKEDAEDNIIEGYEDAFNKLTNIFLDLPDMVSDLGDILYSYDIAESESTIVDSYDNLSVLKNSFDYKDIGGLNSYIDKAESSYDIAKKSYDESFNDYKDLTRYSDYSEIEALLEETIKTTRYLSDLIKDEINLITYWMDYRYEKDLSVYSEVSQYKSNLSSYASTENSYLTSLLSEQRSIRDNKDQVTSIELSIKELELSLADLKDGADELDIRTKENDIKKKEEALKTAKEELDSCYIYAPFDGVVAVLNFEKGDSVSSGSEIVTVITKKQIAEISLNEVDISKVKIGQKVNVTFDAIDDLNITGEVIEIDTLGTVSQGVVSYNIKIVFDVDDERVKSGMSITADIIIESKHNVLIIPVSAVKIINELSYAQILENNISVQKKVETGLSDDISIEILSGLEQDEEIIIQSVSSNSESSTNSSGGGFQQGSGGGGMMNMNVMRVTR
jgi:HlyD family secretion protein